MLQEEPLDFSRAHFRTPVCDLLETGEFSPMQLNTVHALSRSSGGLGEFYFHSRGQERRLIRNGLVPITAEYSKSE